MDLGQAIQAKLDLQPWGSWTWHFLYPYRWAQDPRPGDLSSTGHPILGALRPSTYHAGRPQAPGHVTIDLPELPPSGLMDNAPTTPDLDQETQTPPETPQGLIGPSPTVQAGLGN